MNDALHESTMGPAHDFLPDGQRLVRERPLVAWMFAWSEPKLRADLDAPVPQDDAQDDAPCPACDGHGFIDHCGPLQGEPCAECQESGGRPE